MNMIEFGFQRMQALAVAEIKGFRDEAQKAADTAKEVAAERKAAGETTGITDIEIIALLRKDAIAHPTHSWLPIVMLAAEAIVWNLEPDDQARREAQAMLDRITATA